MTDQCLINSGTMRLTVAEKGKAYVHKLFKLLALRKEILFAGSGISSVPHKSVRIVH